MKILQISSARVQYPGGTEKVVWELSRFLAKQGHEVTILQTNLYEKEFKFKKIEKKDGINIITCKNDRFVRGFGYSKDFKKKLKEIWKEFDVVHIYGHGRFTSEYTLRFIKNKKPVIYSACGFFHNAKDGLFKKIYNQLFRKSIRNITFCTALTEIEKKEYFRLRVPLKKIKVIPAWIDLEKFKIRKINKKKILKKYGLKNKKTLLYVGRIHESKGLQYVVEAIKDVDVNFLIVGRDAAFSEELNKKIKKLELSKRVKLLGSVEDKELMESYALADVFVLFSSWEGFGIVVLEAMASGLPVIVSDRGSLPTLIKNKENGLIAKFPNVEELRKQIKLLFEDKKLFNKIKKNSLTFAKGFEYSKIAKQYEELYGKTIER